MLVVSFKFIIANYSMLIKFNKCGFVVPHLDLLFFCRVPVWSSPLEGMFSFEVHYGGHFVKNPGLTYVGGDIKYFNNIDPDYMSRFEIWGLLKGLNMPINTQICFKMPDDEFALLNSEATVMYMFGMFRDEPYIHIYVGEVNDNGDVENNNGNQQGGVEAVGNSNINANQGVGTGNDGLGVGGVNDNVEPEVDHDVNESETESDDSYTPESEQSFEYDSDFDYFLDGDTLSDSCDIGDNTTEVTSGPQLRTVPTIC